MKNVVIIGAGPAGLTAAYELLRTPEEYHVIIVEASGSIGGISKTVNHNGNRMDLGGHRFFSRIPEVNSWWEELLPDQGQPAKDDLLLERETVLTPGGPDPEKEDRVMLHRHRVSRILFDSRFYEYPISLKPETFRNMGFRTSLEAAFSYGVSFFRKLPEDNLENFYINRFGRKLYEMFFEYYTENLWGRHPREIDASWGAQRVKGLSVSALLKNVLEKKLHKKGRKVETSLIESFKYPKFGPGQLWEEAASRIIARGGTILMNTEAVRLDRNDAGMVVSVTCRGSNGTIALGADIVLSSMPVKDLIAGLDRTPEEVMEIAKGLPYRDYMTVGLLTRRLKLKNRTKLPTVGDIVPDCWIYVQDRKVKLGRVQIYNNWSPYLVCDPEHTVWVGLEYFVQEGDELWNLPDEKFACFAVEETVRLGLIDSPADVLDTHVERMKKAYPAYFDSYSRIGNVVDFLNTVPNLYCIGRNGQHRYNNMDHSMCTAFEAVRNIRAGKGPGANIWAVNTEQEYHEEKGS